MKKTARLHKVSIITLQDVCHVLILIAISLLFCLMPKHAFGQPLGSVTQETVQGFEALPPPVPAMSAPTAQGFEALPPPVPAMDAPAASLFPSTVPAEFPTAETPIAEMSATMTVPAEDLFAVAAAQTPLLQTPPQTLTEAPPTLPEPAAASATPLVASQFTAVHSPPLQSLPMPSQPYQLPQQRSPSLEMAAAVNQEHPFTRYWGIPSDPQTQITGKPMTVAELFSGTRSPAVRRQLLQAYWDLSGLLAVYHFRLENERLAAGTQQDNAATLLREQRRTAEVEFIKQQWVLAGLLNQFKGRPLRELELPIPADFPLYPRYQTFADQIARSERTQYLGRMIPIQEQLIESKNSTWKAASEMVPSAAQPPFAVSTQRTMAFLELTRAVIEYNQMIAEYALETIPPHVPHRELVGAVVRLPKAESSPQTASSSWQPIPATQAMPVTQGITLAHHAEPMDVPALPIRQVHHEHPAIPAPVMMPER